MDQTKLILKASLKLLSLIFLSLLLFTNIYSVTLSTHTSSNLSLSSCEKKSIQKHFLSYGIYIPFDDILIKNNFSNSPLGSEKKCELLIPFGIQVPLIGVFVHPWKHKIELR